MGVYNCWAEEQTPENRVGRWDNTAVDLEHCTEFLLTNIRSVGKNIRML